MIMHPFIWVISSFCNPAFRSPLNPPPPPPAADGQQTQRTNPTAVPPVQVNVHARFASKDPTNQCEPWDDATRGHKAQAAHQRPISGRQWITSQAHGESGGGLLKRGIQDMFRGNGGVLGGEEDAGHLVRVCNRPEPWQCLSVAPSMIGCMGLSCDPETNGRPLIGRLGLVATSSVSQLKGRVTR